MKNLALENYSVNTLSFDELLNFEGGSIFSGINPGKVFEVIGKVCDAIAAADAVERFVGGFNSVHCHN